MIAGNKKYYRKEYNKFPPITDVTKFYLLEPIPKIPMPPVVLRIKDLDPELCRKICDLDSSSFCKISDNVAGVLAWNRIADSEDGIHSRDDHLVYIIAKISSSKVTRNTNDTGSQSGKRPDLCIYVWGVSVVRMEEEADATDLNTASLSVCVPPHKPTHTHRALRALTWNHMYTHTSLVPTRTQATRAHVRSR